MDMQVDNIIMKAADAHNNKRDPRALLLLEKLQI